ncbi:MAG TPA: GNAT family N-acetyltransferase [Thermoplasmata archaeon]
MDPAEFGTYLEQTTREYAEDNVRAGRWSAEEALGESQKQLQSLLPDGLATPHHSFFTILGGVSEEKVGLVWLAIEPRGAFVYDLRVFEAFRRRGHAAEALRLIEGVARERGAKKISLDVFADNQGARKLYSKLGYAETNVMMSKPLPP